MKKMIKNLALISALTATSSAIAVETEKELTLDADSLSKVFVDTGAGSLVVQGKANIDQIQVKAEIIVDGVDDDEAQEWFDKYMDLSVRNDKGTAIVCARFGYQRNSTCSAKQKLPSSWFGWNNERKINLTVYVPEQLELEVDDGSGHTEISDIANEVFVDDGSGHLTIENIAGNLKVDDGSGNLTIINVDGDLWVDDGSGKMIVDQVTGEVEIDDGSGNIKITNIAKTVYIDDGSGSVYACGIDSNLTVDDGSGSVDTCAEFKGKLVVK